MIIQRKTLQSMKRNLFVYIALWLLTTTTFSQTHIIIDTVLNNSILTNAIFDFKYNRNEKYNCTKKRFNCIFKNIDTNYYIHFVSVGLLPDKSISQKVSIIKADSFSVFLQKYGIAKNKTIIDTINAYWSDPFMTGDKIEFYRNHIFIYFRTTNDTLQLKKHIRKLLNQKG